MAPKKADAAAASSADDADVAAVGGDFSADAIRAMKVGDLRAALASRGLDSKGLKAELVGRLLETTGAKVRGLQKERGRDERTEDENFGAD